MKGNILNIERYHYTDGNGIRIMVFMKGCNLRCPWCSNPESQRYDRQLAFNKNKCVNCVGVFPPVRSRPSIWITERYI